jgi:hypothetical protein
MRTLKYFALGTLLGHLVIQIHEYMERDYCPVECRP